MPITAPLQSENPWLAASWNITVQSLYVKLYGLPAAQAKAAAAGTTVGGPASGQAPKFPGRPWPGPRGKPGRDGNDGAPGTGTGTVNPFLFLVM